MLELIQAMLNDVELNKLVGSNIFPTQTDYLGDCILYSFHTTMSDRITERCRLQLTIIASTMATTLLIEDRIKYLLLSLGDEPLTNDILRVEINGGGTLYDNDRKKFHRIIYFNILKRGVYNNG